MYTIIYKNKKKSIISIALAIVISFGIILQGCTSELVFDDDILNSPELEEYIIAGADLASSVAIFKKELNKIDFSKLEVTQDSEGRMVKRLPAGSISKSIEEKVYTLNEKKETLREKFPEFSNFSIEKSNKYFQICAKKSLNVSSKLLEFGYATSRSMLKSGTVEFFDNDCDLRNFLWSWCNNSSYVEVMIIRYSNGYYDVFFANGATSSSTSIILHPGNGSWYFKGGSFPNSSITDIGHTHIHHSNPGNSDNTKPYSGISYFIFFNNSCYYY